MFKFEYISFFLLLAVLTVAMFVFRADENIVNIILGALIGVFTSPFLKGGGKHDESDRN